MMKKLKQVQKLQDVVRRQNLRIAVQASIASLIAITGVVATLSYLTSVSNVRAIANGMNVSLANLIAIGDVFQIERQLSSLLIGNVCENAKLLETESQAIISQVSIPNFDSLTRSVGADFKFGAGKLFVTKAFPVLNGRSSVANLYLTFSVIDIGILKYIILAALGWLLCLAYILSKFSNITNEIAADISNFSRHIKNKEDLEHFEFHELWHFEELTNLNADFLNLMARLRSYKELDILSAKDKILVEISQQVAHDIRSPLAALEMISGSIGSLPEDRRVLIRSSINRIRDIANSLVQDSQMGNTPEMNSAVDSKSESVLLSPVIEAIVTESRYQYRDLVGVRIEYIQTRASYGIFVSVETQEFKRILSNIINNAVEALVNNSGTVQIEVETNSNGEAQITISDDGRGIEECLLPQLGTRGFTSQKIGGSGLGLSYAVKSLKKWAGSLKFDSKIGVGTVVTIALAREKAPLWFLEKLHIKERTKVIVFDDDQSIHQIWKGRFESLKSSNRGVDVIHMGTPEELRQFVGQDYLNVDSVLFLMDYEIIGSQRTGLDLIEEFGLHNESILVTSRYEETNIRMRCDKIGVKLVPKPMSGFVPIEIS